MCVSPKARRTRALLVLIGWCLWAQAGAAEDPEAEIRDLFLSVQRSLGAGELEKAESDSRRILGLALEQLGALNTALGDFAEAERAYLEACRMYPLNPQSCLGLSAVSLRNRKYEAGKEWTRRVLELDPLHHEARHALGSLHFMEGDLASAADELRTAYALRPEYTAVAYTLGLVYLELKRPQDAQDIFQEVLEKRGDSAPLRVFFGRAYRETSYFELAAQEFRKAIDLDSNCPKANYYLGLTRLLHRGSRAIPEAISHFEAERRINPTHIAARRFLEVLGRANYNEEALSTLLARSADETLILAEDPLDEKTRHSFIDLTGTYRTTIATAYQYLARTYTAREDLASAARSTAKGMPAAANALVPSSQPQSGSVRTLRVLARLALQEKDTAAAWKHASRARELAPASPDVLVDFADVSLAHGMVADAVFALRLLRLMYQDRPEYLFTLGSALVRAGDFPAAIESLSRYTQLRPEDPRGHLMLGMAKYLAGENDEAARHLRMALELRSVLPDAHFYLAQIGYRRGEDHEARARLEATLEQAGEHPRARVALAKILSREGRQEEALDELRRAVKLLPQDSDVHFQFSRIYSQLGDHAKARQHLDLYSRYKREEAMDRDQGRKIQF
ncbi:MAG: tetratricopeptide repeat protein [Luteitalea sp.]|nr:tetratricopeptide repeat protein [Luteitalea sp.]